MKVAGDCHYNVFGAKISKSSFWYKQSQRGLLCFKHIHNEGISSLCVLLNSQQEPCTFSRRPWGQQNTPAFLLKDTGCTWKNMQPVKLARVTFPSLY